MATCAKAEILKSASLGNYTARSGVEGRNELDRIFVQGVPPTADSYRQVQRIRAASSNAGERVALARILGALYREDDPTGFNSNILADLQEMFRDADREVARMALLVYSRLGYWPGTLAALSDAHRKAVLSADDYFGELAHQVENTSGDDRLSILALIASEKNRYAGDILAHWVSADPTRAQALSSVELTRLRDIIAATEINFPSAKGEFGLFDAMRFAHWLDALSATRAAQQHDSAADHVVAYLSAKDVDPRKLLAYFMSPGPAPARIAMGHPQLDALARNYAAQFPASPAMREAVRQMDHNRQLITAR